MYTDGGEKTLPQDRVIAFGREGRQADTVSLLMAWLAYFLSPALP